MRSLAFVLVSKNIPGIRILKILPVRSDNYFQSSTIKSKSIKYSVKVLSYGKQIACVNMTEKAVITMLK